MHCLVFDIFHSFIHIEHLYSACSRKLLRGAPNSITAKTKSLKVGKECRLWGSGEVAYVYMYVCMYYVCINVFMYLCIYPYMYLCFVYICMYNYMISENNDGWQCLTTL